MNTKKLFCTICILAILLIVGSVIVRNYTGEHNKSIKQESFNEWVKCKNKEVPIDFQVTWKIKLKFISVFGGLYGKGYVEGNKSYPVFLRWDSESEFYKYRKPHITMGDNLIINGTFWGISENGDVIIDVKRMKVIQ